MICRCIIHYRMKLYSPPLLLRLESVASIEIQIDSQFDRLQIYSLKSFSVSKIFMTALLFQAGSPASCHCCGIDVGFFSVDSILNHPPVTPSINLYSSKIYQVSPSYAR